MKSPKVTGRADVSVFGVDVSVYAWNEDWLVPTVFVTEGPTLMLPPWIVIPRASGDALVRHALEVLEQGNPMCELVDAVAAAFGTPIIETGFVY